MLPSLSASHAVYVRDHLLDLQSDPVPVFRKAGVPLPRSDAQTEIHPTFGICATLAARV